MGWESSGVVGFDLGPLLEGQMRTAKLKSAYNLLIIGPRGFGQRSKLGFYVPFNSQGHIGTGPQNCHLWDLNPQR